MIILPGPVVLRDPLPSGWRRCSSLGCGAPTGHDGAHVPEAVPPAAVAGPEVDVGAELRCTCEAEMPELDCPEHGGAALAWIREHEPATMARLLAALREPAPAPRAERIEAAARAVVAPDVMLRAALDLWNNEADPVRARALRALHALRAALCTCTAHGPDPACVDHGEALRAWQKRSAP